MTAAAVHGRLVAALAALLAAADVDLDPVAALRRWAGGVAAAVAGGLAVSPAAAAVFALVALVAPAAVLVSLGGRREARVVEALPDALERLAADLRGGATVLGGLETLARGSGPLASDLASVVGHARSGAGVAGSLTWWRRRRPVAAVAVVAGTLEVAHMAGGGAAGALEGMAAGLRQRREVVEEAAALSAQARVSALVVGVAPLGTLGFSALVDERVPAALLGTGPGRLCLAAGFGLEALAALWMRRILRWATA